MFEENIKMLVSRINTIKDNINTEEATKTSLIMPFFQALGYDVFNPLEFMPEYTADVGIKKHEKVDYAIMLNNEPIILIEAKSANESLAKHDSQLFRYFGVSKAKFAILTNGIIYKFFTDLDEPNKMDLTPFLQIDLFDLSENDLIELKKFRKEVFDVKSILDTASDLKYLGQIKKVLKDEFANPSNEFVKHIISKEIYSGRIMPAIIDKFKPIVKKSLTQYINDLVNDKIKNALDNDEDEKELSSPEATITTPESNIDTTEQELQCFYIIKSILFNEIDLNRISYKDTQTYFGILLDKKVTKWICRLYIKENVKYIIIPSDTENIKYSLNSIDEIYQLSDKLVKRINELL